MISFLLILSWFLASYNTMLRGRDTPRNQSVLNIAMFATTAWHFFEHGFLNTMFAILAAFLAIAFLTPFLPRYR